MLKPTDQIKVYGRTNLVSFEPTHDITEGKANDVVKSLGLDIEFPIDSRELEQEILQVLRAEFEDCLISTINKE